MWSPEGSCVYREDYSTLLEDIQERNLYFIGHNLSFDIKQIHFHLGEHVATAIRDRWLHDTQIMSHVCTDKIPTEWLVQYNAQRIELNKELPKGYMHRTGTPNSLKTLAPYWLKVPAFWEDPTDHNNDDYVLKDCEYTYRLAAKLLAQLTSLGEDTFYLERMIPWANFLLECELKGIQLDTNALQDLKREKEQKLVELKNILDDKWLPAYCNFHTIQTAEVFKKYDEMMLLAQEKSKDKSEERKEQLRSKYASLLKKSLSKLEPFNLDSPKQMLWLLKDYFQLNVLNFEGKESTGVEVLERLAGEGREDIRLYLEYRGVEKILTSFLPTYEELAINGNIHAHLNITGTRTGRLSCSDPNLQQVPAELYKVFKARDGYSFINYDLEAIEAKLIALFAQEPELYHIIQSGESFHDHNAITFFSLDCAPSEVKAKYPIERYCAKTVGFALCYGAGSNRLINTFTAGGFPVNGQLASEMLTRFHEKYENVKLFHRAFTRDAASGDVHYNIFGRPIRIQDPEDAYMTAFNTLVQSTASDINLNVAYRTQQRINELDLDAQVLLLVHDMIMIEAKDDVVKQVEQLLKEQYAKIKLSGPLGPIEITASGGIGKKWEK